MDQNIKNRLVGIAVIFALAVIFLPMILDGSGVRKDQLEVVIPPQPLVSGNPEFEPKIIELQARVDALPDPKPRFVDEHSDPEREVVSAEAEPTPEADEARQDGGDTASTDQGGSVERTARTKPAPSAEPKTGGDSWVLQVGSFQDRNKALQQRDKLRRSNIAAVFIEQFKINSKSSFRVRLGPFLNRDQTKIAQNKIKAKHNIDGIIMKYER